MSVSDGLQEAVKERIDAAKAAGKDVDLKNL